MSDANKDKAAVQGSLLHRAVQKIENVFDGLKKDLQEAGEHARGGEPSSAQQQQQQQPSHPSDSFSSSSSSSHPSSSKTWHWKGLDGEPARPAGNPGWQGQQTETGHGGFGSGLSPKHATTEELNANSDTRPQDMDLHGQERGGGAGLGSPYTTGAAISSTSGSAVAPKLLDTPSSFAAERDFSANLSEYAKQQHIGSRYHHPDSVSAQSTQSAQSSSGAQSSVLTGSSQSTGLSLSQSASSASSASTGLAQAGQSEQAPVESGFGGTIDNSSWRAGVAGSISQLSSGPDYGDLKSPKNNPEMQE